MIFRSKSIAFADTAILPIDDLCVGEATCGQSTVLGDRRGYDPHYNNNDERTRRRTSNAGLIIYHYNTVTVNIYNSSYNNRARPQRSETTVGGGTVVGYGKNKTQNETSLEVKSRVPGEIRAECMKKTVIDKTGREYNLSRKSETDRGEGDTLLRRSVRVRPFNLWISYPAAKTVTNPT